MVDSAGGIPGMVASDPQKSGDDGDIDAVTPESSQAVAANLASRQLPSDSQPSVAARISLDSSGSMLRHVAEGDIAPQSIGVQEGRLSDQMRLCRAGELDISATILRGAPLKTILGGVGRFWRRSPVNMAMEKQEQLYHHSQACGSLDMFFSHTWRTPGAKKTIATLVRFGLWHSWGVGIIVLALVWVLSVTGLLPQWGTYRWKSSTLELDVPVACWCTILGPLAMLIGMCTWPDWPTSHCPSSQARLSFLDIICIDQVHEQVKVEGIYSMAGFLSRSKQMIVLWSDPYFSRKWCTFEMAAYLAVHPKGQMVFAPIFMEVTILVAFLAIWIFVFTYLLLMSTGQSSTAVILFLFLSITTPVFALVRAFRPAMRNMAKLFDDLAHFDVRNAECSDPRDAEFVHECVRRWFRSEDTFNEYVQTDLLVMVKSQLLAAKAPYRYAIWCNFPLLCMITDVLAGLIISDLPKTVSLSFVMCVYPFCCFVAPYLLLAWPMTLANRFRNASHNCVADASLTFFLALGMSIVISILVAVSTYAYKVSLSVASAVGFVEVLAGLYLWRKDWCTACARRSTTPT